MIEEDIKQLLDFFHLCEKLKIEKRHSKTSDGENDRVASHSWRMAIILMFLSPFLEKKINLLEAIKMSLIHDLPEVITGDQAYFKHAFDEQAKKEKELKEEEAIKEILSKLPLKIKDELSRLWFEYENQNTMEAKIVKAIDKIEAQIQHNEADISVWNEYDLKYYNVFLDKFCSINKNLNTLKNLIQDESEKKLISAKLITIDIEQK